MSNGTSNANNKCILMYGRIDNMYECTWSMKKILFEVSVMEIRSGQNFWRVLVYFWLKCYRSIPKTDENIKKVL